MSTGEAVAGLGVVAGVLLLAAALSDRRPAWQRYERDTCQAQGKRHRGGPGRADCGHSGEVKYWARPVDAGTVHREYLKGRTSITAANGFTGPARDLGRQLGVRLIHRSA